MIINFIKIGSFYKKQYIILQKVFYFNKPYPTCNYWLNVLFFLSHFY